MKWYLYEKDGRYSVTNFRDPELGNVILESQNMGEAVKELLKREGSDLTVEEYINEFAEETDLCVSEDTGKENAKDPGRKN